MNLANKLTLLRVLMIPVFLVALLSPLFDGQTARYVAAGIFILAALTDSLDGYVARKYNMITNLGKFMDPLADKLLVCAALVALVELGDLPSWVVILIISRELMITGFRVVAANNHVVLAANFWGKLKTVTQMIMIIFVLVNLPLPFYNYLCVLLYWLAAILTVVSAIDYLYHNFNVLKENEDES